MQKQKQSFLVSGKEKCSLYLGTDAIYKLRSYCSRTGMKQCHIVDAALTKELEYRERAEQALKDIK